MASFTDNLQALTSFTPYVAQVPTEAMVQVGTQKQAQYNDGIQKIQSNIDQVAGMDIFRDVDKQYLQSKLNQLGGDLKKVAAGDFSNYQLVNSVGGMISNIAKDKNIQTAVSSTQRIRKGEAELEAAKKAGKSSVQNEDWWREQVNSYAQDINVGNPFTGAYVEYTDVDSKLRQIADKVHEYDNSIEIPYKRDNEGNVLYFTKDKSGRQIQTTPDKGKPVVDQAMLEISTKGKSAQKIYDNFISSLNENDQRQLEIDSWHHYRGVPTEVFKRDILSNYENQKKLISDSIVDLSLELKTNTKLTTAEKAAYQARINDFSKTLSNGALEDNLNKQLASLEDPRQFENLKYSVYTEKYLKGLANSMSYESMKTAIKTNPYFQADMDMKELQFKYDNARREQANFDKKFELDKAEFNLKNSLVALPGGKITESMGLSTDIEAPTVSTLQKQIDDYEGQINQLMINSAEVILPKDVKALKNSKSPEDYNRAAKKYYEGLISTYRTNPDAITKPADWRFLNQYRQLEIKRDIKNATLSKVREESKVFDNQLEDLINSEQPLEIKQWNEDLGVYEDFNLSPKDVLILNQAKKASTKEGKVEGAAARVSKKFDKDAFLAKFQGTPLEQASLAMVGQSNNSIINYSVSKYAKQLDDKFSTNSSKIIQAKKDFESNRIAQLSPEFQTQRGVLDMQNPRDRQNVETLIGNMYTIYDEQGTLNTIDKNEFSPETITSWKTGKESEVKDLKYVLEKKFDGKGANLYIYKGSEKQRIPLSQSQFQKYFPEEARENPMTSIKEAILSSPAMTTNTTGVRDSGVGAVSARFSGDELPLVRDTDFRNRVRFDIEGASDNNGSDGDLYSIRIYVQDGSEWKTKLVTGRNYLKINEIPTALQLVGTTAIKETLQNPD